MRANPSPRPSAGPPRHLFDFEGCWRFRRKILDRTLGQLSQGQGSVNLVRDGEGLIYDEEITLSLPGQKPITGTRRYLWTAHPRGVEIFFDDGRPFHLMDLSEPQPSDLHDCAPDRYQVIYDLADWPVWGAVWEVRGPRKDYRMDTLFVRAKGSE
ncbi:hypothetical protein SAMN05421853_103114 [Roseivivax halotolerans]|uniref:DUF6314 domain-containing protein n=1 Tax=Roseivivax halotolerans TaxID=93684 RepID=A0A1I5X3D4_9RHOB|nr:DUF6314 family protein [Roseivivax halotolerans]SFQ26414.1 hypothetical protein SAMN05421853_103114 [Roseivivax halotolerans]